MGPGHAAPSRSDLEDARSRLMQLERDFELVVERYNVVHEHLTTLQARIAASELEVRQIEQRMRVRRDAAVELATELYKGGRTIALEGVLAADSLADLDQRVSYLETSTAVQSQVFERLAIDRTVLDKKIEELDRQRAQALSAQRVVDDLRTRIEAKVADQADEVESLRAQIEEAERREAAAARRAAAAASTPSAPTLTISSYPHPAPAPNGGAQAAVDAALSQVGKPYQWGAAGPNSYDCSGLTMWAWAHGGVSLPHSSAAQYSATSRVSQGDLAPGDLLFFGSPIHHVAMYIGNGQMVEAPYSGASVRVTSASRSDFVGAGRP
jgi:cell wall-associated NlpC family hydrolase